MKSLLLLTLSFIAVISKSQAQDSIRVRDASYHVGQKVTFLSQAADFDSRMDATYLYFGDRYPKQWLTVIVKRTNEKKHIKLKRNIMLGRKMVYFTGTITSYTGEPDSSATYDIVSIKRDIETDRQLTIGGTPMTAHFNYTARTTPIDLRNKLVMIITEQDQIGRKTYPTKLSLY